MATGRPGRGMVARFDNLGMTWKMLLPVVLAVACLVAVGVTALSAFTALSGKAEQLNADAVRPLAALGAVRDAEGDARVAVHEYAEAPDAAGRKDARADVDDADAYMTEELGKYRA